MTSGELAVSDDLCPQCYGRGWVSIGRRRLRCTCVSRKVIGDAAAEQQRAP